MDGLVSAQALRREPVHRSPYRQLIAHRDLVLDGRVHSGMKLVVRRRKPCAAMVVLHLAHALIFAERTPFRRIGSDGGIVCVLDVDVVFVIARLFQSVERIHRQHVTKAVGAGFWRRRSSRRLIWVGELGRPGA